MTDESDDTDGEDPLDSLVDEVTDGRSVPLGDDGDTAPDDASDGEGPTETGDEERPELPEGDDDQPPELEGERAGPLGEMADEFEQRREEREAEFDDDLFESVDVGDVDSEALWEQVSTDDPSVETEPDAPEVRTISKSKYCQRCEFFTDPPDVGCTHDGTTIRSEATMDEFEVVDCPKILEDERLERTR